jgi:hypothetical protein
MKAGIAAQRVMKMISRAMSVLMCFRVSDAQRLRGSDSASAIDLSIHGISAQSATSVQSAISYSSHATNYCLAPRSENSADDIACASH